MPWIPVPSNQLEESPDSEKEHAHLNAVVDECIEIVEAVLKTSFDVYSRGYSLSDSNQKIETFLKRVSLAVLFVSYFPQDSVDNAIKLNLHLPTLPADGFDELMETVSNVREFYSYVNDPTSITTTMELFEADLKPLDKGSTIP